MNKKTKIIIGVLLLAACAMGSWFLWGGQEPAALRFDWKTGKRYVYELEYATKSEVVLELNANDGTAQRDTMNGQGKLGGQLHVDCVGKEGESTWLRVAFAELHTTELQVMGQTVLSDPQKDAAALTSASALVQMGSDGQIARLRFSDQDSSLGNNYLQTIIGDIQVTLGSGASWKVHETTQMGESDAIYKLKAHRGTQASLTKSRPEYKKLYAVTSNLEDKKQTVEGATQVEMQDGVIDSLVGQENLAVDSEAGTALLRQSTAVRLRLIRADDIRVQSLAELLRSHAAKRDLGQIEVSDEAARRASEQQAAGMTTAHIVADLQTFANGGALPHHNRWLWRATGALALDPEGCAQLAPLFRDPQTNATGRALIADLLVMVDNPKAQEVLIGLLSDPSAQAHPDFIDLLQSAANFSQPSKENVSLIRSVLQRSEPTGTTRDMHLASAHALGTAADKLRESGSAQDAAPLVRELIDRYSKAEDSDARQAFLAGLGNAAAPETEHLIAEAAKDDDPSVRQSAVTGLRKYNTPSAAEALLASVSDSNQSVQAQALSVLKDKPISHPQLLGLQNKLAAGEIHKSNINALAQVIVPMLRTKDKAELSQAILQDIMGQDIPARLRYSLQQELSR
ncbi:MAG: HEAT repeat domain-containing protein [Myxococcota bacterium]|nr:HEAT repeat domain-containing protein [Myxococcota bacterium]